MTARFRYLVIALLTAGALGIGSSTAGRAAHSDSTQAAGSPIKIGLVEPFSGSVSYYGQYANWAWQLAMKKYGSTINGHPIQLVRYDGQCTPAVAVNAAKQALGNGVVAVFGPGCTGPVLAALPELKASGVPHVVIAFGTNVTQQGDKYLWRVQTTNATLNASMARYMSSRHITRIAIAHDTTAYSVDLDTTMLSAAKARRIRVPLDVTYAFGATDFASQIEKIKSSGIQDVYLGGYDTDVGRFIAQARQLGLKVRFYGPVTFETPDFLSAAGKKAATGSVFMSDYVPAEPQPQVASYTRQWEATFHRTPTTDTTGFYVGAAVLIKALKVAGAHLTPSGLNNALAHMKLRNTPYGNISFTPQGNLKCPVSFIGKWLSGGRYKVLRNDSTPCSGL